LIPLISQKNLEKHFIVTDFIENASSYIPKFDIYIMTSTREGLPITIYEAFYQKTPVISTRAGGIPEAITNFENGLLSNIQDYKSLAKNISTIINNPKLISNFTDKSYQLLHNKFTSKQLAEDTLKVYKAVIK